MFIAFTFLIYTAPLGAACNVNRPSTQCSSGALCARPTKTKPLFVQRRFEVFDRPELHVIC